MAEAADEHPDWAVDLLAARRVLVLGCPGAGKTTLAHRLRAVTGLPLVHLDDVHWGAGWQRPGDAEWVARQRALVARPDWIIEGNYLPTVPVRAERATAVLVVDTPTATCLYRAVRRALRIRAGDVSALPAAVRTGDGGKVRATKDFRGLLRKIRRFRRHDFWSLLAAVRDGRTPHLVVAVVGRSPARRVAAVRRGLAARSWPGVVVAATTLDDVLATPVSR